MMRLTKDLALQHRNPNQFIITHLPRRGAPGVKTCRGP